jgi:hypothetical protein
MRKIGWLAGAALGLVLLAPSAQAQDYKSQVGLKMVKVSAQGGKGAVLVDVANGANVRLDVEVVCSFFSRSDDLLGKGSGVISVVPNKSDPIEVRAQRPFKFEKASCTIESAKP